MTQQTQQQRQQAPKQAPEQAPEKIPEKEGFWALYWFQQWQTKEHPLAGQHLSAYLQEPCYWAVENITRRFVSAHFSLADGFQGAIAQVDRILTRYNPTYGSSLKAYARTAFANFSRDYLRQQKAADICSDWALLRRLSQTQLKESLRTAGFIQVETDTAIWKCFKAICIPDAERIANRNVRTLASPSDGLYAQIAERYNQQFAHATETAAIIDAKAVAASLQRSIQAARGYLNPNVLSLNQPQYGPSSGSFSGKDKALLTTISLSEGETPMAQMMAAEAYAEQQEKMAAIGQVLQAAIASFEPHQQTLLQLYYQKQLTQKEIAQQLGIKQYQVSRQLSRVRQQLLLIVAKWSQDTLHISVESAVLATISEVLHEWLQHTYLAAPPITTHSLSDQPADQDHMPMDRADTQQSEALT
ncbi:MAG: sigma-70 family RNA polymerase sigma factor [Cyanobacteria bacterium J06598_1]